MEGDDRTFKANFTSEGVAELRERVKEKLQEYMGDYTDDTLVEYVIVLLKNGRRKAEARNELNVFLGDDSGSFISWLWDHLGSHLNLYVLPRELLPDEAPKSKSAVREEVVLTESHQIESEPEIRNFARTTGNNQNPERVGLVRDEHEYEIPRPQSSKAEIVCEAKSRNSIKSSVKQRNRDWKGLMRDEHENEVPRPTSSKPENIEAQDDRHQKASRRKRSLSPEANIQKKRRRSEERRSRKKEISQTTVSAPRRLLQFAVRDAVATSRPHSSAEPSLKRLRSVVSTSAGDSVHEERPQKTRPVAELRTAMSAAIKAVAEAVRDVSKVRNSRNVFDRLGHATDVSDTTNDQVRYRGVTEDGEGNLSDYSEDFHLAYDRQIDSNIGNVPSLHDDTIVPSDLRYVDEDDTAVVDRGFMDVSRSGVSGGNWVEDSAVFQYGEIDDRVGMSHKDLDQPTTMSHASLKIASAVNMNTRKSPQYQEVRNIQEMTSHKIIQERDTMGTKSEAWLMKENNHPLASVNGNARPDTGPQQESQNPQAQIGLYSTGPPTEDADSRTIYVSNVHFAATKDSLSRHFNKFGEVLKVIILTDSATGQPKGSAYIEFMRKEAAEHALSLDGTSFMSRILKIVRKSSAQPEVSSTMAWPRVARASPFAVSRFGRAPFPRAIPSLYRGRASIKPGARSFQWKRDAQPSVGEVPGQSSSGIAPQPPIRSLTYVRPEPKAEAKTNGSSGTA